MCYHFRQVPPHPEYKHRDVIEPGGIKISKTFYDEVVTMFTFLDVLYELRSDPSARFVRLAWNQPQPSESVAIQYVTYQMPDEHSKMGHPYLYMVTMEGKCVPWLPSQIDIWADDWKAVPKSE